MAKSKLTDADKAKILLEDGKNSRYGYIVLGRMVYSRVLRSTLHNTNNTKENYSNNGRKSIWGKNLNSIVLATY